MSYRDSFERCPRCQVELVDARAARGCRQCGGMWLPEDRFTEMVQEMVPAGVYGRVVLDDRRRGVDPVLACPTCGEPMLTKAFLAVPLDRCSKHGIWFDADELYLALRASADPVVTALEPAPAVLRRPPVVPPPDPPSGSVPTLLLELRSPAGVQHYELRRPIIKIGRLQSSAIRIDDPEVARMHALIEAASPDAVTLIDLGSAGGTRVNGEDVNKRRLVSGDVIGIAKHEIVVTIPDQSA